MPLQFPGEWRFRAPGDGHFVNATIPAAAVSEFIDVIEKLRTPKGRWWMLEHFKRSFGAHSSSSTEGWAYSDLRSVMEDAASNAPLFIENFYDACEELKRESQEWFVPDASFVNAILGKHGIGYEIRPPQLVAREVGGPPIAVTTSAPTLAVRAGEILDSSLRRSEELLVQGRAREAVQEILWLLETVATSFRGLETQSGKVEGKYFNRIVADLRSKMPGTTLSQVLEWISTMHGYLSSPKGGAVRHGIDLDGGVDLDLSQARLFCNLTRSYISYLLVEHDSLVRGKM